MTSPLLDPARWLAGRDLPPAARVLLGIAAAAVAVGGYEHAHLFHRGYAEIRVIGPLFLLNAIASLVTVVLLAARRPAAFVVSALAVSVGSLVAIVLTRTTGLFGFEESGYDVHATVTVAAEAVAVVTTILGAALARGRLLSPPPTRAARDAAPEATGGLRVVLGTAAVVVLGGATLGIGQGGGDDAGGQAGGPSPAVAALGPVADRGRRAFVDEGCGGCHRLADAGSTGRIGPDLDAALTGDDLARIRRSILEPQAEATPGYPPSLMPDEYGERLSPAQLDALVRYLAAVAETP